MITFVLVIVSTAHALDSATYIYDEGGRLLQVIHSDGTRVFYTYDDAGNTESRTVVVGAPPFGEADLSLRLWADDVESGSDTLTVHARVNNYGPATASDIALSVPIPETLDVLSHSSTLGSCAVADALECTVTHLAAGESFEVAIVVRAGAPWSGTLTGSVSASEHDPEEGNGSATLETEFAVRNDLSLFVYLLDSPVVEGDTVRYRVEIGNRGNEPASNVALTFVPAVLHPPLDATTGVGSCSVDSTVFCTLGTLAPGTTLTVDVSVLAGRPGRATVSVDASSDESAGWATDYAASLTHEVADSGPPAIVLDIGETSTAQYGNRWGTDAHRDGVLVLFESDASTDLELGVVGYDVDWGDEVRVLLNGVVIGTLNPGANNQLTAGNVFNLPASLQVDGVNTVRFEQALDLSFVWGVTDFELQPAGTITRADVVLTVGEVDPGEYGKGFGAVDYGGELIVGFVGTGNDMVLELTGYDIDTTDEVQLLVNGQSLDYLTKGPNNGLNVGDRIVIPAALQSSSYTEVLLKNRAASNIWGVTNLHVYEQPEGLPIDADVILVMGEPDHGEYGKSFGAFNYGRDVMVAFQSQPTDVVLDVTGYDIDFVDEVDVIVNGEFLMHLTKGPNNGLNAGDSILIPAAMQSGSSYTEVLFYNKSATYKWGVTDLLLRVPAP